MNFWIICLLITLIAALIGFYPLWRSKSRDVSSDHARDELNKAFYFNRLKEIQDDEEQGLLDNLEQSKLELQQNLLQDIPEQEVEILSNNIDKHFGKVWALCGFLLLLIIAVPVYLKVGSWQEQEMLDKTVVNLPYFYQRVDDLKGKPLSNEELNQFIFALRVKLQQNPDDALGWWRLGELAMKQSKMRLAMNSYERAYKLDPKNNEFALSYARFLMFSKSNVDKANGISLVRSVLRKDHTNMQALSLLAFQYFSDQDYRMAAATWALMIQLLPPNDPRVPVLEKSLMTAQAQLQAQELGDKEDAQRIKANQEAQQAQK